jgi:hypothetical protein
MWLVVRLFNHRGIRIAVAALSFVLAALGATGFMGVFG